MHSVTGLEVAINAREDCPYTASTPFCIHKREYYCWFRHLDRAAYNPFSDYYGEIMSDYDSDVDYGFGLFD